MAKKLLIITEDIIKIQSYSGKFGKLYSLIYLKLLSFKISLIIYRYQNSHQITLLASDYFNFPQVKRLYYSQEIKTQDYARSNPLAWQLVKAISKQLTQLNPDFMHQQGIGLTKIWQTKLVSNLSYNYLVYFNFFQKTLKKINPQKVIIINRSPQAQMALFQAKKNKFKVSQFSLFSLSFLTNQLNHFFRRRELTNKLNHFLNQAVKTSPVIKSNSKPILLSVDFFRHLKTLAPVYAHLKKKRLNPWFVTDINSIKANLTNFNLKSANYNFLARFLPSSFYSQHQTNYQKQVNQLHQQAKNLFTSSKSSQTQFVTNLFFLELSPLIKHGLILTKLYLEAGEQMFTQIKPRAVVVVADTRMTELSLIHLAKKHHLGSLLISPRTIIFDREPTHQVLTNYISVTGQQAYQKILNLGVPKKKIQISGDPRYEFQSQLKTPFIKSNFTT